MIKIKRNIGLLLYPIFLTSTPITTVFADDYEQGIIEKEKKIDTLTSEKQDVISKKQEIENQVVALSTETENILKQKTDEEQKINTLAKKISVLQENINSREIQLRNQARDVQTKQGAPSIVEVVLNSESLSDAVKKTVSIKTVLNAEKNILEQQNRDKEELQSLEKEASQHLAIINNKTIELKEKQEQLIKLKLDKEIQINAIDAQAAIEENEKQQFEQQKVEAEKKRAIALKELEQQKLQEQKAREQAQKQAQLAAEKAAISAQNELEKAEQQAIIARTALEKKQAEQAQLAAQKEKDQVEKQQEQVETVTNLESQDEIILPEIENKEPVSPETSESNDVSTVNTNNDSGTSTSVNNEQSIANNENNEVVQPPVSTTSGWSSPLNQALIVTSPFGLREDPTGSSGSGHDGVDLAGTAGTPIHASKQGTVVEAGFHWSAGNHVVLKHSDGHYSYYMHMNNLPVVQVGQSVSTGQVLGGMGTTGNSTGVHLHFGVSTSLWSGFIDPQPLLGIG